MIKTYLNGELMAGVDLQLFVVNISTSATVQLKGATNHHHHHHHLHHHHHQHHNDRETSAHGDKGDARVEYDHVSAEADEGYSGRRCNVMRTKEK